MDEQGLMWNGMPKGINNMAEHEEKIKQDKEARAREETASSEEFWCRYLARGPSFEAAGLEGNRDGISLADRLSPEFPTSTTEFSALPLKDSELSLGSCVPQHTRKDGRVCQPHWATAPRPSHD
jgi:hypothetical protein